MTTEAPEFLYEISPRNDADALVKALHRLATAVEQNTLAILDAKLPAAALAPLPPVQAPQVTATFDGCLIHHQPWKVVPAGISKRTGKAYDSFRACSVAGCDQRPRV